MAAMDGAICDGVDFFTFVPRSRLSSASLWKYNLLLEPSVLIRKGFCVEQEMEGLHHAV